MVLWRRFSNGNECTTSISSSYCSALCRCANYDAEIRRLDALRGTPELDFRQLFLVKESLALMFQMMQLPGEALVQYEEIEALLSFASTAALPENNWPLTPLDIPGGTSGGKKSKTKDRSSLDSSTSGSPTRRSVTHEENDSGSNVSNELSLWANICQQGAALLTYSINHSRMKVLKNRISILELHHYVFARECFFLLSLGRPAACAEKGMIFISSVHTQLQKKYTELNQALHLDDIKNDILLRARNTMKSDGGVEKSGPINNSEPNCAERQTEYLQFIDLWAVIAAVQLARGCRDNIASLVLRAVSSTTYTHSSQGSSASESPSTSPALARKKSGPVNPSPPTGVSLSAIDPVVMSAAIDDSLAVKIRDSARHICDLLQFAKRKLNGFIQPECCSMVTFRRQAIKFTEVFRGWDSYETMEVYKNSIHSNSLVPVDSDSDNFRSGNRAQLFSESIDNLEEASALFLAKVQRLVSLVYNNSDDISDSNQDYSTEISELGAEVYVTMSRLLAEHQEIAGRWRFAWHSKTECADVLISRGQFSLALSYLRSAIESLPITPGLITSHVTSNSTSLCQGHASQLHWSNLLAWTLRKALLCARATHDKREYVKICLSLLGSPIMASLSAELAATLQADISMLSVAFPLPSNFSSKEEDDLKVGLKRSSSFMNESLVLNSDDHFKLSVITEESDIVDTSTYSQLSVSSTTKLIHDESYKVRIAKCSVGESYLFHLDITSTFPNPIEVDSVVVSYSPFVPLMHGSPYSSQHNSTAKGAASLSTQGHGIFNCYPASEFTSENGKIVLRPGKQLIGIKFSPSQGAEYVVSRITLSVGGIVFVKNIVPDMNKLHPFFMNNTLICVGTPAQAVKLRAFTPTFSPVNQPDFAGLIIETNPGDTVTSLFVRAWAKPASFISAAALTECRGTDHSHGHLDSPRPSVAAVEIQSPSRWTVSCSSQTQAESGRIDSPNLSVRVDGVVITDLPSSVNATLVVPYRVIPEVSNTSASHQVQKYLIAFFVEGTLLRNGCNIDFELGTECTIVAGEVLAVEQRPTEQFDKGYFCQCIVRNVSPIPLKLISYHKITPLKTLNRYELCDDDCNLELPSDGIVLQTQESYNVGLHLTYCKGIPDPIPSSKQKLLRHQLMTLPIPPTETQESVDTASLLILFQRACLPDPSGTTEMVTVVNFFNRSSFEAVIAVPPPLQLGSNLEPVMSMDYSVSAVVKATSQSDELCSAYIVGEPLLCQYSVRIIFPDDHIGERCFSVGLVSPCSEEWMAIGVTKKEFRCSSKRNFIHYDAQLIPITSGINMLPRLQVAVIDSHSSITSESVILKTNKEVEIQPKQRLVCLLSND
mmetsp:Transcript_12246/g.18546  ORF Transcript_12246/g.18546 Transcript_12246/m.18546 type:complete len:1341 (+) Transcript_12246:602-4624(+)